uniref:Uncharacterized protein n=1 Tax=Anguilla anguilla TaxID=7936 RepID=A0A0E9WR53_ANGAN
MLPSLVASQSLVLQCVTIRTIGWTHCVHLYFQFSDNMTKSKSSYLTMINIE